MKKKNDVFERTCQGCHLCLGQALLLHLYRHSDDDNGDAGNVDDGDSFTGVTYTLE